MRADVPLFASLLAASAAAQNVTGSYNSSSSVDNSYSKNNNAKIVAELEAEVAALHKQIDSAKQQTCDAPASPVAGGSGSGSGSGNGASSPAGYSAPVNPAGSQATAASGEDNTHSGADSKAPAAGSPAGYTGSNQGSSNNGGSPAAPASGSDKPAGYSSDDSSAPSSGSDKPAEYSGEGSNAGSSSGSSDSGDVKNYGEYYAPNAPTSGAKSTSTVTVIVTAGQTETAHLTKTATVTDAAESASETGDVEIVTATETYCGKGPIPSAPVSSAGSGSNGNVGKASSALSSVLSSAIPSYGSSEGVISSTRGYFTNGTHVPYPTGASSGLQTTTRGASDTLFTSSSVAVNPAGNSTTSAFQTGVVPTGTGVSSSASATATAAVEMSDCATFCESLDSFNGWDVTPLTCTQHTAGTQVSSPSGQSSVGCAASFTPQVDLCQVTMNIKTSGTAETYVEVWLPNANETSWNGRSMNTDNGGLNGCIHYVDMQYVTGMGFAAIGDNAGHNGSSFDGTWTLNNNEAIIDWSYRSRHAAVEVGKETIDQFYNKAADYSYYVGCSAGGAQGIQSAEKFPNDFDGIISGAAANDFNHLQGWSATFRKITGSTSNDTFLTSDDWVFVQSYILDQCDEALDGVADGIIEDPTRCEFDASVIPVCSGDATDNCLTATQIQTVEDVFKPLYDAEGNLIYPALLYGAQVDAFKLGLLNGGIQGIAQDWFRGAVFNDSSFDITTITDEDIALGVSQDDLHGNPSAFSAELGEFNAAGKKLMVYHGMADPMTSGGNSQRYYLKVAQKLGLSNTEIDEFMRFFRISGMAHCGVGGISGAGAWMFGQNGAASAASNNIVSNLVDWVENGNAPDTLRGTKFWYDTPSMGVMFERDHCRFPYRTTYKSGDSTLPESWGCEMIENWQDCADKYCNADGQTFT